MDTSHGNRVRQRPPGSLRFFTHAMGRDGVGNAWKVNRTLEVGGSTPLGSTPDSAGLVLSQLSHARLERSLSAFTPCSPRRDDLGEWDDLTRVAAIGAAPRRSRTEVVDVRM